MNNVIGQDYHGAKTQLTEEQKRAIKITVKKEQEIKKIQQEIGKILNENNLGLLDIDKFKREKNVKNFLDTDFS